ncbi:hypothetical protein FRACA_1370010 [Frankia canadensis]|uniref:Uncharacterized protein n=1 Tax=Frankia canadensis TaxID=1836972 RepID=A0A2I2KKZ7_9ACTN|nr:hypothetical protein FRACA_1370010 [Frankia canadensis]SOU53641.1 hypothetical protein FRACA_1370010 [Frankia canadensis]
MIPRRVIRRRVIRRRGPRWLIVRAAGDGLPPREQDTGRLAAPEAPEVPRFREDGTMRPTGRPEPDRT